MKSKLTAKEWIQLSVAVDHRISEIETRILENTKLNIAWHIEYWQERLQETKSLAEKIKELYYKS